MIETGGEDTRFDAITALRTPAPGVGVGQPLHATEFLRDASPPPGESALKSVLPALTGDASPPPGVLIR